MAGMGKRTSHRRLFEESGRGVNLCGSSCLFLGGCSQQGPADLARGWSGRMGRDEEFRDVFADDYDRVVRTVYLILRDQGHAEEIAQEAFLELLRHWTRVSRHDLPDAWVRRVAIRMAVRSLKRERALEKALLRVVPEDRSESMDAVAGADVLNAVAALPARQRAAVVLFYYEDRPVDEVAQILDCSPSTARVHLHKARKRLGALLSEEVPSDVR